MYRFFAEFPESVPWFLPGIALWTAGAIALAPWAARKLSTRRVVALLLLVSLGFVVLATLSPTAPALAGDATVSDGCDLSRIGLSSPSELFGINDMLRNVVLFIPLGLALGLLPLSRRTALVVALAFALPFVIETLQLALPGLGRGCQSADVIDNALGLAVGIGVAVLLRLVAGWRSRHAGPPDIDLASD